jgi:hypothetical protein
MLSQKYEPESEEVVLGCRKLHNLGPRVLYSSLSFITIIKPSIRRIWVCSKQGRDAKYKKQSCLEILMERNRFQDLGLEESIILKFILNGFD